MSSLVQALYIHLYMKCRSKGNPFNTTIIPSPPAESPLPASTSEAQPPSINPVIQARGPSSSELPHSYGQKYNVSKKVVWVSLGGFFYSCFTCTWTLRSYVKMV